MRRRFMSNSLFDINNYLTIVALEDGLTASLSTNACEYCVDGDGNWKTLSSGTNTETINTGQTLSFRGNLIPNINQGIGTFTISKSCNLEGNCMSMLFGNDAANNFSLSGKIAAFFTLFYNCTTIKSVSSGFLPATTLSNHCYDYMFGYCTNLTQAPELPATTLANSCYYYMFYGTNVLPDCSNINFSSSSVVSSGGLQGLFAGTKVTDADLERILPKNSNGKYCLPVTTLADSCYAYMFQDCTSLTQAPELPATTLVSGCYSFMFDGCSKLNYIKAMFTTTPSVFDNNHWVYNVASTGRFIKNKNATWNVTATNSNSYIGVPYGWTVVNAITFTIDGTEYQAEEGMTWGEWVDSEYNTIGAFISGTKIEYSTIEGVVSICALDGYVLPSDIILHVGTYKIEGHHAGGGAD